MKKIFLASVFYFTLTFKNDQNVANKDSFLQFCLVVKEAAFGCRCKAWPAYVTPRKILKSICGTTQQTLKNNGFNHNSYLICL